MTALKDAIAAAIDRLGDELETLSRRIHDNPELGYQEVKAAGWLTEFLAAQGFKVERGVAGVETAFRATIETGEGPTIAIMCEYDALPGDRPRVRPQRDRDRRRRRGRRRWPPSATSCRRGASTSSARRPRRAAAAR